MIPFFVTKALARAGLLRYTPAAARLAGTARGHLHRLSGRVLAAPLDLLTDPAAFPDGSGDGLDLNLAAPHIDTPAGAARLAVDRGGPPPAWGLPALRHAIAERAGLSPGARDEVLVTRGAAGALAATLDAFVDPGDRVAVFAPCSPLFTAGVLSRRARVRWVRTTVTPAGELACDAGELARAVRGTKLVLVADPSNPLGASLDAAAVDQLAWAANRYDALVYVDETFGRYRPDGAPGELAARPNLRHRLLVAGSVSASHGLGSARVGWLRGPGGLVGAAAVASVLSGPFVPAVCQHLAARELDADDVFGPARDDVLARRHFAQDRLAAMHLPAPTPAAGYFLWVDVRSTGLTGRTFAERLARDEHVRVGPGDVFGPGNEHFIRVSAAEADGRLREGLARLARFTARLRGDTAPAAEEHAAVDARPPAFSRA